jgi:hypothetical protein
MNYFETAAVRTVSNSLDSVLKNRNAQIDKRSRKKIEECTALLRDLPDHGFLLNQLKEYEEKRNPPPYNHQTTPLYYEKLGELVKIDWKIAPLISLLWKCGIDTLFSCQGNAGAANRRDYGYVMVSNGVSFDRFVDAINQCNSTILFFSQPDIGADPDYLCKIVGSSVPELQSMVKNAISVETRVTTFRSPKAQQFSVEGTFRFRTECIPELLRVFTEYSTHLERVKRGDRVLRKRKL